MKRKKSDIKYNYNGSVVMTKSIYATPIINIGTQSLDLIKLVYLNKNKNNR